MPQSDRILPPEPRLYKMRARWWPAKWSYRKKGQDAISLSHKGKWSAIVRRKGWVGECRMAWHWRQMPYQYYKDLEEFQAKYYGKAIDVQLSLMQERLDMRSDT